MSSSSLGCARKGIPASSHAPLPVRGDKAPKAAEDAPEGQLRGSPLPLRRFLAVSGGQRDVTRWSQKALKCRSFAVKRGWAILGSNQ
jgi:hypothetical protein